MSTLRRRVDSASPIAAAPADISPPLSPGSSTPQPPHSGRGGLSELSLLLARPPAADGSFRFLGYSALGPPRVFVLTVSWSLSLSLLSFAPPPGLVRIPSDRSLPESLMPQLPSRAPTGRTVGGSLLYLYGITRDALPLPHLDERYLARPPSGHSYCPLDDADDHLRQGVSPGPHAAGARGGLRPKE